VSTRAPCPTAATEPEPREEEEKLLCWAAEELEEDHFDWLVWSLEEPERRTVVAGPRVTEPWKEVTGATGRRTGKAGKVGRLGLWYISRMAASMAESSWGPREPSTWHSTCTTEELRLGLTVLTRESVPWLGTGAAPREPAQASRQITCSGDCSYCPAQGPSDGPVTTQ
jgi:hypothetical protein